MNCNQTQKLVDDYLNRSLPLATQDALQVHLNGCPQCREQFERIRNLQQSLAELPVPEPSWDFSTRVFSFLHAKKSRQQHSMRAYWMAAVGGALAASFALWLVFSSSVFTPESAIDIVQIQIEPNRVQNVNLVFDSATNIDGATVRIELPDNLQLAGAPERRVIEWKTSFKQGNNRLSLPLIVTDNNTSRLTTRITHDQTDKTFYMDVTPHLPGQSMNTLSNPITI
jgi:hypothetical protein